MNTKRTGILKPSFTLILWLLSTVAISNNTLDSLDFCRISVDKYSETDQLLARNIWTIELSDQLLYCERTSIQINGFFLSQEGMTKFIVHQGGLHTAVFQQIGDSATTFSNILIKGVLEQILKNSTSVEEVVQKFLSVCQSGPILYISGGEYIKFNLDHNSPIGLSIPTVTNEREFSPIVQWYTLNGQEVAVQYLPKGVPLVKMSSFPSGSRKVAKIIIN